MIFDPWIKETEAADEDRAAIQEDALREDYDESPGSENHNPQSLTDAHIAETVANRALRGRFCWAAGLAWMRYRRGRWSETTEATVAERVRLDLIDQYAREARAGAGADRLKSLTALLAAPRIRAVVGLDRGILEVDAADFDRHPDLLNVGNGVVNLVTGDLLVHDPALLLTKHTTTNYVAGATSPDWTVALDALPNEVADWVQVRVGQAATGHPTPDDIMPVLQGGGSNGKTTIVGAITRALGGHAVVVPERVLMANPSDHPTELMALRGARLAVIEETPEARRLSVKRLKDVLGTPTMTARLIARNNVTWEATHSLFLTTNYIPRVDETDHGTWRRLALVKFPYRFTAPGEPATGTNVRGGVAGLRERLRDGRQGQHEAILAWIVAGAREWYSHDRVLPSAPPTVKDDTIGWRADADLICAYVLERITFDRAAHIITGEMYADFTAWITGRGHKEWSDQTLSARFAGHGIVEAENVEKRRTSNGPGLSRSGIAFGSAPDRYMAWTGVRFRNEGDSDDSDERAPDQQKHAQWQGWQGCSDDSHTRIRIERTGLPLPPLPGDQSRSTDGTDFGPYLDQRHCPDCHAVVPPGNVRCGPCFRAARNTA